MKYVLYILCLMVSLQTFASEDVAQQAETYYKNKDYKNAILSYEMLVKEGLVSYKLFYNLGNAYYKNNQIGKAIYNYELAHKLMPNNEDIKTNLHIANEKTIDKIESKENFFLGAIKSGLVNRFTTTAWAWISILALTLSLVLAFWFYVSPSTSIKRGSFFIGILCFILFISSMVLGFSALRNKQQISFAIITTRETKIFEEPNASSNSKFSLHDGTKVAVLDSNDDWTNIKLENGNEGWVKTADVGLF